MASNPTKSVSSLLPYTTIEAAASGDVDAINAVLKHYERYIAALATRTLYDENGSPDDRYNETAHSDSGDK